MTVNAKLDIKLEQQSTGSTGLAYKKRKIKTDQVIISRSTYSVVKFFPARFSEKYNYSLCRVK